MSYQTHHVLIFDKDPVVLSGAGLKIARHTGAKLFFADKITSDPFPSPAFKENDKTPWKLHIIEHGSVGSIGAVDNNLPWSKIARWIIDSGIADQPQHNQPPKVRLDVCSAGVPGNTDVGSGKDTRTVVEKLSGPLSGLLKGRQLSVEGCKGTCVGPWASEEDTPLGPKYYAKHTRQVINPKGKLYLVTTDISDYTKWTVLKDPPTTGTYYGPLTADKYAGYVWAKVVKKFNPVKPTVSANIADMAKQAWSSYRLATQAFHSKLTEADNVAGVDMFLLKNAKADYLQIVNLS